MNKKHKKAACIGKSLQEQPEWLQGINHEYDYEDTPLPQAPVLRLYDMRGEHPADPFILAEWEKREPDWLEDPLRDDLRTMFSGLDRKMARELMDCLSNYVNFGIRDYTGLWHIDRSLHTAYNKIRFYVERTGVRFPLYL